MREERAQNRKIDIIGSMIGVMFVSVCMALPVTTSAYELPADRVITWQGNVGVEGGIPNRTTICKTLSPGVTTSQINSALQSCPEGQVVYLSAGTYNITGNIRIPSNKTLRGAGALKTILQTSVLIRNGIVRFGNDYTDRESATKANVVSGYTKGSTAIVLDSVSGFAAGNFVYVDELNDPDLVDGSETYLGMFGSHGQRNFAVIHKVLAVNAATRTLTIDPPAVYTFQAALSPQAIKAQPTYVQYAGVEELTIMNVLVGSPPRYNNNDDNVAVLFQGAANCWAKNIKVVNCGKRCMEIWLDGFRNTITGNWMKGCLNRIDSDRCYGSHTMVGSFNLIENNIYDSTGEGNMTSTAVGNVYAYNYSYDVHRTNDLDWDWMSDWTHGSHSAFNLFEGNISVGIKWDYVHGSGSHNTAFRNRFYSKQQLINAQLAVGAVITERFNYYTNMVGNVLGVTGWNNAYEVKQPGGNTYNAKPIYATGIPDDARCFSTMLRHMNYDYVTNSVKKCDDASEPGCQGGTADTGLPASLYLTAKPSWWSPTPWPAVDPQADAATLNSITNPAKYRFEQRPLPPKSVRVQ